MPGLALIFAVGQPCLAGPARRAEVSFRNDVMPVLSKAGCNAGTCHGNKNGKGGFKLSLRGQDADLDYLAITDDLASRRVDLATPGDSLILLKPTTGAPHEGGLRFPINSHEFRILSAWISRRCPNDLISSPRLSRLIVQPQEKVILAPERQVQIEVKAQFSNGETRDVSNISVFEAVNQLVSVSHDGLATARGDGETTVLVRFLDQQFPVRLSFVPNRPEPKLPHVNNYIDRQIFAKLRTLRTEPSLICSDEIFLRRAYLDLLGILPTASEARAFVKDASGNKRKDLVDRLLNRTEFAEFWALKWADLLRVEAHSLDEKGVQAFHQWIRAAMASNKPLDRLVRELILARGSTYTSPASNYYRPNRDAASRSKAAAQVFLGARIQCAECHNHPSDRWTQKDYYDWASVFSQISYKVIQNNREISTDEHEWKGEQVIYLAEHAALNNPRTGKPATPRLLGMAEPIPDQRDRLEHLALWLTSPTNHLFARVQVNRIWFHLMGRGLVDPPDDFRATNPASHPELLDQLARDFVAHQFDLRYVIRLIMNSRTYQLSSESNASNAMDDANFSHALIRRLSAEQLLDCQSEVTEVPLRFEGFPAGMRAAQLPGVRPESKGKRRSRASDQFLEFFGKPPRLLATDTERSCECNMAQAFQMISGPTVTSLLAEKENCLSRMLTSAMAPEAVLEELFWKTLSRSPTSYETVELLPQIESAKEPRAELEDLLWGLLNSKEFVFRH